MYREEFRLRNFKLGYPVLRDFTHSRLVPLPVLVAFRLFTAAYNLGWFIYNIYLFNNVFLIYLTNWSFTVLNVYFVFASTLSCIALYHDVKQKQQDVSDKTGLLTATKHEPSVEIEMEPGDENEARDQDALRLHHKIFWVVYVISANAALVVTTLYWAVLFSGSLTFNSFTVHTDNSINMLIDTLLSAMPVRLFHFVYPLIYALAYLAFTVVYWALGGTNFYGEPFVYSALDYSNFDASTGALIAATILILPVFQLILFGLTKLRDCLGMKCLKE